ncbi:MULTISPECIES: hypothetical protein [Methanobacterium]|jgi:hypothetical protein|uniref:Uncharacterized protein n=1 Tax=Methanobacterium veterum TaxID=408577 RepID=A0A9E5A2A9_9EURY|nr:MULTISPECIES: hypothetical protein [Methanobacterium]MCZ3366770.1 hypothetical protein [Methanobacterium veterum]MCZ3374084.1 hypothetical protein [Methanobacterium veterum]
MPDLGPLGRGGARRRTRRRMMAMNESNKPSDEQNNMGESVDFDTLKKLAKLLKNKGVITEDEYDLLFE